MNKENVETLKKQVCHLGNSAHQIRNLISQSQNETIPESMILGDVCGRIEDACKDMMRTSLHFKYLSYFEGWKVVVCRIRRHVRVALRIVAMSNQNGYTSFADPVMEQLNAHFKFQEEIVKNIDAYLNAMFISFSSDSEPEGFKFNSDFSAQPLFELTDFSGIPQAKIIEKGIENLNSVLKVAQESSNLAHEVQNIVCKYQVRSGFEEPANHVFGAAGEVENYAREIQRVAKQHTHNIPEMKDIIRNLSTEMLKAAQRISNSLSPIKAAEDFKRGDDVEQACQKINQYGESLIQIPLSVLVSGHA